MNDSTVPSTLSSPLVSLLMTGSELMSGDTVDSNSAFLARALLEAGLSVTEMATVGDDSRQLVTQVLRLSGNSDLLIVNGGLGPTQDDLTAAILAQVAGCRIETHASAREHVLAWCSKRGIKPNATNLKQAELPAICQIFPDAPGSAPAFYLGIEKCLVIATPGVPSELKQITREHLLPFLRRHFSLAETTPWSKIQLLGIGESRLQEILDTEFKGITEFMEIGFRAKFPTLELKYRPHSGIAVTSTSFKHWEQALQERLSDYSLGTGDVSPAGLLVEALTQNGKHFASAESCTGGLVASQVTRIPGASAVFPGSIVCYANAIKHQVLGVPGHILETAGAVSRETVTAMLQGVLEVMQADIGVAVSGIAGPTGGTPDKPAGTVWIAWGDNKTFQAVRLHIPLERPAFQDLVATLCIDLARRWALGQLHIPAYLARWSA